MHHSTTSRYVRIMSRAIDWSDGSRVFMGQIDDITEAANQAKTAILTNIGYEIKTPMNGIVVFSELARDSGDLPKIRDYLDRVLENAERLFSIINVTLGISKTGSGEMKPENAPDGESGFEITFETTGIDTEKKRRHLMVNFVRRNQAPRANIRKTADGGDIKPGCGIAHSLKDNARHICEHHLQETGTANDKAALDDKRIRGLFNKLGFMLTRRNPECIFLADEVKTIPGAETLAPLVEDLEFKQALAELSKLQNARAARNDEI